MPLHHNIKRETLEKKCDTTAKCCLPVKFLTFFRAILQNVAILTNFQFFLIGNFAAARAEHISMLVESRHVYRDFKFVSQPSLIERKIKTKKLIRIFFCENL